MKGQKLKSINMLQQKLRDAEAWSFMQGWIQRVYNVARTPSPSWLFLDYLHVSVQMVFEAQDSCPCILTTSLKREYISYYTQ